MLSVSEFHLKLVTDTHDLIDAPLNIKLAFKNRKGCKLGAWQSENNRYRFIDPEKSGLCALAYEYFMLDASDSKIYHLLSYSNPRSLPMYGIRFKFCPPHLVKLLRNTTQFNECVEFNKLKYPYTDLHYNHAKLKYMQKEYLHHSRCNRLYDTTTSKEYMHDVDQKFQNIKDMYSPDLSLKLTSEKTKHTNIKQNEMRQFSYPVVEYIERDNNNKISLVIHTFFATDFTNKTERYMSDSHIGAYQSHQLIVMYDAITHKFGAIHQKFLSSDSPQILCLNDSARFTIDLISIIEFISDINHIERAIEHDKKLLDYNQKYEELDKYFQPRLNQHYQPQ